MPQQCDAQETPRDQAQHRQPLNYNGEGHGLSGDANRKDWAVRMQQFFDHYLQGAPAPVWMEKGVPAVDKGRTLGLELVEPDGH